MSTAKKSVFRGFMSALQKDWSGRYSWLEPLSTAMPPALPKASSFYAGVSSVCGLHVHLHFQHASKSWQVGQFTINFLCSSDRASLPRAISPPTKELTLLAEGTYRVQDFLGGGDRWWHLRSPSHADRRSYPYHWFASDYSDTLYVFHSAVSDVNLHLGRCFELLGLGPKTP